MLPLWILSGGGWKRRCQVNSRCRLEFVSRQNDSDLQPESNDLIVTIGTAAADTAYRQIANSQDLSLPILSVLITESSFSALAKRYFGSDEGAFVRHISSVFIDQPVDRSIRLAKLLLPAAKKDQCNARSLFSWSGRPGLLRSSIRLAWSLSLSVLVPAITRSTK